MGDGPKLELVAQQAALPVEFDDPVVTVFTFWKAVMNHPRAQLGPKRRTVIENPMRWGYQVDDLRLAILGCTRSPKHMGQNPENMVYDDLELILRDEAHIDKFMRLGQQYVNELLARDRDKADAQANPPVPMPAGVRAKIEQILGRALKRPSFTA